jgi:putative membrane protein
MRTDPTSADPHRPDPARANRRLHLPAVAAVPAAIGVLLQVAYPLLDGTALRVATIGSVLALAAAAVAHAVAVRGAAWGVAMLVVVGGTGWLAEAVGVATGFPFGTYEYAGTLGPKVADVPVLVPLAWVMLAYPAFLAGQALGGRRWGWALGAWTLATWDLFLDPQMVGDGHWAWAFPEPGLPGIPGIPLTNYAGWVLTATVMMLLLGLLPRRGEPGARPGRLPHDAVPALVLAWTYGSQVLANLVFFGRPAVAAWGGVLMGLTVVPYLRRLRADLRPVGQ